MAQQYSETPSGAINGVNTTYTLVFSPSPKSSLQLYLNGLLQAQGVDYVLAGSTFQFIVGAPQPGNILLASYTYGQTTSSAAQNQYGETPSGLINSANTKYTLAFTPTPSGALQLYLNGVLQDQGVDYTLLGNVITYIVAPPQTGDVLLAYYPYQFTTSAPSGRFTNTLQSVINFCSTHGELLPLTGVGGYLQEPGLSMCNDALATLLTSTNNWKINRKDYPNYLVTAPYKQDYIWGGASAFTIGSSQQGWAIALATNSGITVQSGVVTVNTIEPHQFAVGDTVFLNGVVASGSVANASNYNSVITSNTVGTSWTGGYTITAITANSFSFAAVAGQNNGDILGAPGIYDYGWMQEAVMYQMADTGSPQYSKYLYAKRQLPIARNVANPESIAVMTDNLNGTLNVRFYYAPGSTSWGAKLSYQMAAPVKTDVLQNWAPFPDHYAPIYRQAVVYLMYRYINSARADSEYKKLQIEISKIAGFDDNEQTDVHVQPTIPLMDDGLGTSLSWWG